MKKTLLILMGLLTATAAFAQTTDVSASAPSVDLANRFAGYHPTVIENEAAATQLFNGMISGFKKLRPLLLQFGSECTKRAETWSYDLFATKHIESQKVFVFYTVAYHDYYAKAHGHAFKWWFHVSPYVLIKNASGDLEERVIDRTFADRPQTMKEWTDIFIESKKPCVENVPFEKFEGDVTGKGASYDKTAHCYLVRAPMFDMFPGDIDLRERGQKPTLAWDMNQVFFAAKALPNGARSDYYERTGLDQ